MKQLLLILQTCIVLFCYTPVRGQKPTISSFSPSSAASGSSVTVTGSNFAPAALDNVVTINGHRVSVTGVAANSLTFLVPSRALYGTVTVTNTTTGRSGSSSAFFSTAHSKVDSTVVSDFESLTVQNALGASALLGADIDMDGRTDILVRNPGTSSLYILRNNASGGSPISFEPAIAIPTKTSYSGLNAGLRTADMDGDGKWDMVITNEDGSVSIYLNRYTTGVLSATSFNKVDIAGTALRDQLVLCDIDGDGRTDLITRNAGGLNIRLNQSSTGQLDASSFGPEISFSGTSPISQIVAADLDGDGRVELLTVDGYSGNIQLYRHQVGSQPFDSNSLTRIELKITAAAIGLAIADFNGDGRLDLAISDVAGFVNLLENRHQAGLLSAGSFVQLQRIYAGKTPGILCAVDTDGDGRPDLFSMNQGEETLALFRNTSVNGKGPWLARRKNIKVGNATRHLLIADLNQDGLVDLGSIANDITLQLRRNIPSAIPQITSVSPTVGPIGTIVSITGKHLFSDPNKLQVFFGSRKARIVHTSPGSIQVSVPAGTTYAELRVFDQLANRHAISVAAFRTTFPQAEHIHARDFRLVQTRFAPSRDMAGMSRESIIDVDGDGFLDFMFFNLTEKSMMVIRNAADGKVDCNTFGQMTKIAIPYPESGFHVADIDGDGLPDLLSVKQFGREIGYHKNISKPGAVEFGSYVVLLTTTHNTSVVAVADLDGDGRPDILGDRLYRNTTPPGAVHPTFDQGNFITPGYTGIGLKLVDLNGDGKKDLVITSPNTNSSRVSINLSSPGMVSDSTFTPWTEFKHPITFTRDIDGDGKVDLVGGNKFYPNISVTGGPLSLQAPQAVSKVRIMEYADLNGDGVEEILGIKDGGDLSDAYQDTLSVYQNRAILGSVPIYTDSVKLSYYYVWRDSPSGGVTHLPTILAVTDLNNDGRPEIISTGSDNELFIFENTMQLMPPGKQPQISSFAPAIAAPGTNVKIQGSNFNTQANLNHVLVGSQPLEVISASAGQLTVKIPSGAVHGYLTVRDSFSRLAHRSASPLSIKLGDGNGAPILPGSFLLREKLLGTSPNHNLLVLDLNNDQVPELVTTESRYTFSFESWINIYRATTRDSNNVPGGYELAFRIKTGYTPINLQAADLDGDGRMDIVFNTNRGIEMLENQSNGKCGLHFQLDVVHSTDTSSPRFALGDLDNDGKTDIVLFNGLVYFNRSQHGNISFDPFEKQKLSIANTDYLEVRDFDGDGLNDIAQIDDKGRLQIYLNGGMGSNGALRLAAPYSTGPVSNRLLAADVDGDGKWDLVASELQQLLILQNRSVPGSLRFDRVATNITTPFNANFHSPKIYVFDLDGDGRPELLTMPYTGPQLEIYRNISAPGGAVTFDQPQYLTYHQDSKILGIRLAIADINGDSRPDIILPLSDDVRLLLNGVLPNPLELATSPGATPYISKSVRVAVDPKIALFTELKGIGSAKAAITENFVATEDLLSYAAEPARTGNITANYDQQTGVLTLSSAGASATAPQWQQALAAISYANTQNRSGRRTVGFSLQAGTINSNVATKSVALFAIKTPVLIDFSPRIATSGMAMTLIGTDMEQVSNVILGGTNASMVNSSPTSITVVVGTGSSGAVSVQNSSGLSTLPGFQFVPKPELSHPGPPQLGLNTPSLLLTANTGNAYSYQWERNGTLLPGATGPSYLATVAGSYTVAIHSNSLKVSSDAVAIRYVLPKDNLKLSSTSVTCKNGNNGSIQIIAAYAANYIVRLKTADKQQQFTFGQSLDIPNLKADTYSLCITVADQPGYEYCTELVISEPKDLAMFTNVMSTKQIELSLSGGDSYRILWNGELWTTDQDRILLPILGGQNKLQVSTNRACQGTIERTFNFGDQTTVYPNPFDAELKILMPHGQAGKASISLSDMAGRIVYKLQTTVEGGLLNLPLAHLPKGHYLMSISVGQQQTFHKIQKK